jgi:hypothetical protein
MSDRAFFFIFLIPFFIFNPHSYISYNLLRCIIFVANFHAKSSEKEIKLKIISDTNVSFIVIIARWHFIVNIVEFCIIFWTFFSADSRRECVTRMSRSIGLKLGRRSVYYSVEQDLLRDDCRRHSLFPFSFPQNSFPNSIFSDSQSAVRMLFRMTDRVAHCAR